MRSIAKYSFIVFSCFIALHSFAQAPDTRAAFNKIIDDYIGVKDALADSNGPLALSHAQNLLVAIQTLPEGQFTPAQKNTWETYLPKLAYDSRHISEVGRVPHQREHFASLSANLYAVLKAIPFNNRLLYEETCTMTKNTYLTLSSTGKDPYMGMDNCSKVNAALPAIAH